MKSLNVGTVTIEWIGHATFRIAYKDNVVYIDPYIMEENSAPKGDVIFITHDHFDHCDREAIEFYSDSNSSFVVAEVCKRNNAAVVAPGDVVDVKGITAEVLPAYNINKPFHPKEKKYVGYLISIGGIRIYHAGDTDVISEMEMIKGKVDVALLPIGGTYTMDEKEAVEAVKILEPNYVVPMHYNFLPGLEKDPEVFASLVSNYSEPIILQPLGKPRK